MNVELNQSWANECRTFINDSKTSLYLRGRRQVRAFAYLIVCLSQTEDTHNVVVAFPVKFPWRDPNQFHNCWKCPTRFGFIFEVFRLTMMLPNVWAGQNNSDWYRIHSIIWSGGRFLNILNTQTLRNVCLLLYTDMFLTNYAKPLRQPDGNLTYRVHLKHRSSIL